MPELVEVCGGQSDTGTEFSSSDGMYIYLYIQFICGTIYFLTPVAILCTICLNIVRLCSFSTGCAHLTWLGINNGYISKQPETCGLYNGDEVCSL